MTPRIAFRLLILWMAVSAGAGGGSAWGEIHQKNRDHAEMKTLAIMHNCGAYNSKTGVFGWVDVEPAQQIVETDQTIQGAVKPGPLVSPPPIGVFVGVENAHPVPQHKPKVK